MHTTYPRRSVAPICLQIGVVGISLASLISSLFSQEVPPSPVQTYPQNQPMPATQTLSPESLQQLLSPIALYPDALIALILPASTVPSDVVLASRYVAANGDPAQIPNQSWDNSVQSLASYPDVITWMDKNLEWTTSLGLAFLVQPADVMSAIQQLRTQAQATGNLFDTPQQVIVKERTFIRIVPAEPEYLYVPQYDPEIVYVQPYSQDYGPLITFGIGFAVGSWLNYDFDWNRHEIYRGDWQPGWGWDRNGSRNRNGGVNIVNTNVNNNVNVVNINQSTAQPWQASSRSRQQLNQQRQNQQATYNNFGNASALTGAGTDATGRNVRQVPKPSRANFGNRGSGNRNGSVSTEQPPVTSTQPVAGTAPVVQTTTPPDVVGQRGKPRLKSNNAATGENVNKHGQQTGKPIAQPVPSAVQSPQNPAPAQIGGAPAANNSKNKRGTTPDTSARLPQTTVAPAVDQNGRTQPAAAPVASGSKRNQSPGSPPQLQAVPTVNPGQPSSVPPGNSSSHKNNNADRPSNPPVKTQSAQPAPANNQQQQMPQLQTIRPQQPPQAPNQNNSRNKANNPALVPQQQPQPQPPKQQRPQQQPQPQPPKQQRPQQQPQPQPPKQQRPQQQKPQSQPQQQPAKNQEQKAAPPAPKQNPAQAPAPAAQSTPSAKKSDKKKG